MQLIDNLSLIFSVTTAFYCILLLRRTEHSAVLLSGMVVEASKLRDVCALDSDKQVMTVAQETGAVMV